jgi:hypothetical protein
MPVTFEMVLAVPHWAASIPRPEEDALIQFTNEICFRPATLEGRVGGVKWLLVLKSHQSVGRLDALPL